MCRVELRHCKGCSVSICQITSCFVLPILAHMQRCPQYQELASEADFLCQACVEAGTRRLREELGVMTQALAEARTGLSLLEMEVGMVEVEERLRGLSIEEEGIVEGEDCEMEI